MTSKFDQKTEIELQFFPEMLTFYEKCFELYRNAKSEALFRSQLQTICPEPYVDQILKQIQSFIKIVTTKKQEEAYFLQLQQKIRKVFEERKDQLSKTEQQIVSILIRATNEDAFYNQLKDRYQLNTIHMYLLRIQYKLFGEKTVYSSDLSKEPDTAWTYKDYQAFQTVYETYKPYFTANEQCMMSYFLSSFTDQEIEQKLSDKLSKNAITLCKTNLKKKLLNPLDYVNKANQLMNSLKSLQSVYEQYQIYFNESECLVMDTVLSSDSQLEIEKKLQEKFALHSIRVYEMEIKRKLLNPEQLLDQVNKQLIKYHQWENIYESKRSHFTENERMVMDALLSSKTNTEFYLKLKDKLPKKMISIYKQRLNKKLSAFRTNEKNTSSIYYLYQPYIPEEYQAAYEYICTLDETERPKEIELYDKYNTVTRYLLRCEQAVKQGNSLPKFVVRKQSTKPDAREVKINALFPGEVSNMLDRSKELSKDERDLLCLFYGIGTKKHSLEQLQQIYSISNRNTVKNQIYHLIDKLQHGKKEAHPEQNAMARKLREKFVLGSLQLSKGEIKLLDAYYGLTGEKKSIEELSTLYHSSKDALLKKIHYASETVLKANTYTSPAIVKALQNISIEPSQNKQFQDREIRALRLPVKQSIYLKMCPLSQSQIKLLDLFYGLSNDRAIMSTEEIAMKYQIPVDALRYYLYETVRYVLNYMTEIEFQEQMREKGQISEEILEKKLKLTRK